VKLHGADCSAAASPVRCRCAALRYGAAAHDDTTFLRTLETDASALDHLPRPPAANKRVRNNAAAAEAQRKYRKREKQEKQRLLATTEELHTYAEGVDARLAKLQRLVYSNPEALDQIMQRQGPAVPGEPTVDGGTSEAEELAACKEFCLRAGWVVVRKEQFEAAARILLSRPVDRVVEGEAAAMAVLRESVNALRAADPEKWGRIGMAAAEFGRTTGDLLLAFARATSGISTAASATAAAAAAAAAPPAINVDCCIRKLQAYVENMHRNWDAYMCIGMECAADAPPPLDPGRKPHPHPATPSQNRALWLYSKAGLFTSSKPTTDGAVGKTAFFLEFSLCLSRACLGKMIVFIYKWLKNAVFAGCVLWPAEGVLLGLASPRLRCACMRKRRVDATLMRICFEKSSLYQDRLRTNTRKQRADVMKNRFCVTAFIQLIEISACVRTYRGGLAVSSAALR
jgi:hypothetical protein